MTESRKIPLAMHYGANKVASASGEAGTRERVVDNERFTIAP